MNEISFELNGDFIELAKLLKAAGLCESGGTAKVAVTHSLVKVNGELETRRGRKIRRGYRVEYEGQTILVR